MNELKHCTTVKEFNATFFENQKVGLHRKISSTTEKSQRIENFGPFYPNQSELLRKLFEDQSLKLKKLEIEKHDDILQFLVSQAATIDEILLTNLTVNFRYV